MTDRDPLQQGLIDVPMDAADVPENRPRDGGDISGRALIADGKHISIESVLEHVDLVRQAAASVEERLRMGKDEIRFTDEYVFGFPDPPAARGTGLEVVAAVIDDELPIQCLDQFQSQRSRQPRPDDRIVEPHRLDPAPERPEHDRPVGSPCDSRIGKRQHEWGVDIEIIHDFSDALDAVSPVPQPLPEARQIVQRHSPHARILDEQDTVALPGQRGHDLLMTLPDKVPVNGRNANDILDISLH